MVHPLHIEDEKPIHLVVNDLVRHGGRAYESAQSTPSDEQFKRADIHIPGEDDGIDIISKMQQKLGDNAPLVIYITAHPDEHTRKKAEENTVFERFVTKPFSADELLSAISSASLKL